MTTSGMSDELHTLEETRSRLETALAGDEYWRALRQLGRDGAPESAAHRARNTRLKMALAENPIYQAWRHVGDAIVALRKGAASAQQIAPVGRAVAEPASLPGGGVDARRANTSRDTGRTAAGSLVRRLEAAQLQDVGEEHGGQRQKQMHTLQPERSSHPVAPRARTADNDSRYDPRPRGLAGVEPDEATVTFVRRSARTATEPGSKHDSGLLEHPADQPELADTSFPAGGGDEAEVTIVTTESAGARHGVAAKAGTVHRQRKALSDD